ncbi:hypothetical protein [Deinococcus maricopensis]|uniref:Uncharacterized protein n=1 Tax=Deinococcus maricopensis (strain DSM 21211 / LMG 22137 / NRRL B-23946 / LB-34) TaxID=709986 RepID=E8U8C6_DEIML|nr:hypothetical protein [Deinococcus maricopensis]ADV67315.1 hypothetical protein Deima_1666 [Deinococcus maricopensis DSM 21211]
MLKFRRHLPWTLLTLLLICPAQAARLSTQAYLNAVARTPNESDRLGNFRILYGYVTQNSKPTVFDTQNDYLRYGADRTGDFSEMAIWRTTNGKALIGVSSILPRSPTCGDWPCTPVVEFAFHDGRTLRPSNRRDTGVISEVCSSLYSRVKAEELLPPNVMRAFIERARDARPRLSAPGDFELMGVLPRKGTSLTVAVLNQAVAPAYRDQLISLAYFQWDKVRGTFTPSTQP